MWGQPSTSRGQDGVAPAHRAQPRGAVIETPAGSRSATPCISCSVFVRCASVMASGSALVVVGAAEVEGVGVGVGVAVGAAVVRGAADVVAATGAAPRTEESGKAEPMTDSSRK